jgi:hypothetical protein
MDDKIVAELELAFKQLSWLFDCPLSVPTFVPNSRKKGIVRFSCKPPQFSICSNFGEACFHEMLDSLLHHMCHLANCQRDIRDRSNNSYHNRKFVTQAIAVGLTAIRHEDFGWITTSYPVKPEGEMVFPTSEASTRRQKVYRELSRQFNKEIFESAKTEFVEKQSIPRNKFFLKYVCGCPEPHNSVRSGCRPNGANAPKIRCLKCGKMFEHLSE